MAGSPRALEGLFHVGSGESVRQLVEQLARDGHADVSTAARACGMSVRTFQRRLAAIGLSYSRLVLEARIALSKRWLRERHRSITDIAHSLGYGDSANFTRAFRRLNGLSPRAYRHRVHAAGQRVGEGHGDQR